jgi:tetratricopeptide (TPR) repeat protein
MLVLVFAGCATLGGEEEQEGLATRELVGDYNHALQVPHRFEQEEYTPEERNNLYERNAILYAELGARFYQRGETQDAIEYFHDALEYNPNTNKAHFSLGMIYYEQSRFEQALRHLRRVDRRDKSRFPYDINYHTAAQMILSKFPFHAKVTALYQNQMAGRQSDLIIINKGSNQGARAGMSFNIYRVGNAIRDVDTLGVIGQQRTPIGQAEVVRVNPNNSVCRITNIQENYFIQLDDLLETQYLREQGAEL